MAVVQRVWGSIVDPDFGAAAVKFIRRLIGKDRSVLQRCSFADDVGMTSVSQVVTGTVDQARASGFAPIFREEFVASERTKVLFRLDPTDTTMESDFCGKLRLHVFDNRTGIALPSSAGQPLVSLPLRRARCRSSAATALMQ